MHQYTSPATWNIAVIKALSNYDIDSNDVFRQAGINTDAIKKPDERIPIESVARVWDTAIEMTQDPSLGIKAASTFQPGLWHAMGMSLLCCSTVEEALQQFVRHYDLLSDVISIHAKPVGNEYHFIVRTEVSTSTLGLGVIDFAIGSILTTCRAIFPKKLHPLLVILQRPNPEDVKPYSDFFQAPVQFGACESLLVFSLDDIKTKLAYGFPALVNTPKTTPSENQASQSNKLNLRVTNIILRHLEQGEPSQQRVADELHISVRTLQRKLKDEGTSFNDVVSNIRKKSSMQLLQQPNLPLKEIAYRLGFSDQSNFTRAFKRWYGVTPTGYRFSMHEVMTVGN